MLVDRMGTLTETMRAQQMLLAKLAENSVELRATLHKLADAVGSPAASAETEAMRGHLRNMEAYLARLLEETGRSRSALADELRGEFKLLARTIASSRAGDPPAPR